MSKIYVLHENQEWTDYLFNRLEELDLPYESWLLTEGNVDLTEEPPEGIFYSRMSASSHTRGNRYAAELTSAVLDWLEHYDRTVINGSRALELELSKVLQDLELKKYGVKTPKTVAAVGKSQILKAAEAFEGKPFITKHNRAGKGLGVQLFYTLEELKAYVESDAFEEPIDGVTLIQEYIESPESFITRCEFVGGQFLYAVRVDTSEGFELCPADGCSIDDVINPSNRTEDEAEDAKFRIIENFEHPIIEKFEQVLAANNIKVAGIEFIQDKDGNLYAYDINTNTNYNTDAEANVGIYGMVKVAEFLGEELKKQEEKVLV